MAKKPINTSGPANDNGSRPAGPLLSQGVVSIDKWMKKGVAAKLGPTGNDNGLNPDRELLRAAEGGELDKVRFWLKQGANIDVRQTNNDTPLILATREGHEDVVKYLLERKAKSSDVSLHNNAGETARHVAGRDGATVIAVRLLLAGAPRDARDENGATPVFHAAQTGNDTLIEKLAEAKADLNLPDNKNTTPLIQAVKFTQMAAAMALLEKGAGLNAQDELGMTALMYAVVLNENDFAQKLVARGAHTGLTNKRGQTALALAHDLGRDDVARALEQAAKAVYEPFHSGTSTNVSAMRPLSLKPSGETP